MSSNFVFFLCLDIVIFSCDECRGRLLKQKQKSGAANVDNKRYKFHVERGPQQSSGQTKIIIILLIIIVVKRRKNIYVVK